MGRLLARNFSGAALYNPQSATFKIATPTILAAAPLTFMWWFKATRKVPLNAVIFGGTSNGCPSVRFASGANTLALASQNVSAATGMPTVPKIGTFEHYAVTYDGTTVKYYLNGALISSVSFSVTFTTPLNTVGNDSSTNALDGYLADPAIFNRVLTAEEIRAIYEQGPDAYPKDGSCVLDYRFKEGAIGGIAGEIIDYSGKGNHGQLTMGSGRIDPYNIPVPNRVIIAPNMPLVGLRSDGSTGINISDANIAAAFGVDAGQVGVNGISAGAWIKKQRHVVNGQNVAYKYLSGASGYGAGVILGTTLQALFPTTAGAGSTYVEHSLLLGTASAHRFAAAVNGITYGKCFHNGIKTKQQTAALTGNGSGAFNLISSASGNITLASMFFLANRALTDSEVYNIYSKSIFPADVLFWHGPDETGTKIACYRGSYSPINRVPSCDGTLSTGITFTDDVPWR